MIMSSGFACLFQRFLSDYSYIKIQYIIYFNVKAAGMQQGFSKLNRCLGHNYTAVDIRFDSAKPSITFTGILNFLYVRPMFLYCLHLQHPHIA